MGDKRLENCEEFDEAFPMKRHYCQLLSEEQFEDQAETETEKALKELIEHLDKNPDVIKDLLKRKKKEEEEDGGLFSYMKLKMLSMMGKNMDARYAVSESECEQKIEQLKDGMTKAFNYSLESKGRRFSERLAAKKNKKLASDLNEPIPQAPPPPPLPSSSKVKIHVTDHDKTPGKPPSYNTRLRTPLKDINSQVDTPASMKSKKFDERRGSIASMGTWKSIGSLRSLHDELLSIDPNKLLKTSHPRSPGGTPRKKMRSDHSPSSLCNGYSTATPLYKALITGMHQKFRNTRSPSPAVQDQCLSPSGFTP